MERKFIYLLYISIWIFMTIYLYFLLLKLQTPTGSFIKSSPENPVLEKLKAWESLDKKGSFDFDIVNSEGFKDFEHTIIKPSNTYRIIALGDSMTFGAAVKINDTWPKQLERKLNSLNFSLRFEVFNFGIPGAGTLEEVQVFKEKGLKYNPDMVILQFYENDFEDSLEIKAKTFELWEKYKNGTYKLPPEIEEEVKKVGRKERAISGVIRFIVTLEYDKKAAENFSEIWKKNVEKPLLELIELCREKKIKLLVIAWDLDKEEKELLSSFLEKNNIPFIDLTPKLLHNSKIRLPDDHLSKYGYEIIAEEISKPILDIVSNYCKLSE